MSWTSAESQVAALERGFYASLERGSALMARLPEALLWRAPAPGRWSVGECFAHLNITHRAMLGGVEGALKGASAGAPSKPYRLDFMGWLLTKSMEPGQRMRLKTTKTFVPGTGGSIPEIRAEFSRLVQLLVASARRGTEVDLGKLRMESPFRAGLYYHVYSALRITEAHLRRHLKQAEEAAALVAIGP